MSFQPGPIYATLPNTDRGVPFVLGGDPKGKNFLYTCGKSVIIRDIANPGVADVYTQHSTNATVAKYSPSGFYIASGDQSGKVRIWDTTQKEHILKCEYQPISGKIKDLSWDTDSKRIAVGGEGREKFGHAFLFDTGTSVGEVTGHSKAINSVDLKPTRPYRLVTASEDHNIAWLEGPPFKCTKVVKDHTRFVNAVRFSPNGELVCSAGADGMSLLLDGRSGDVVGKLGADGKAHAGGIYAVAWSPDSSRVLTASGDKTCKVFDVGTQQVVTEFKMGNAIEDQQVSCLWQGDYMLSVSVSGHINYLDKNNPDKPLRVITGHKKNVTCLESSSDCSTLYSGCYTGRVTHWQVDGDDQAPVGGNPHSNEIRRIQNNGDTVSTLGFDKKLRSFSKEHQFLPDCLLMDGEDPEDSNVDENGTAVVVTRTCVIVAKGNNQVSRTAVDYEPTKVARHPSNGKYAVAAKGSVRIEALRGDLLCLEQALALPEDPSCLQFSPCGQYLAVGVARKVILYSTDDYKELHTFIAHMARVLDVAWSPDSSKLASGSIDTNIVVYTVDKKEQKLLKGAHPLSTVTCLKWISNTRFVSGGHDCCLRTWEFKN